MSPAVNPFVGGAYGTPPPNPQFSGGAMEVGGSDSASGVLGAMDTNDPAAKMVPAVVAAMVLAAVGVIVLSHFLGVRAGTAITIGKGK